jgi:hypothetical protein
MQSPRAVAPERQFFPMRTVALLVPLALASLPLFGCSSDKNHAERADAAAMDPSTVHIDYNNPDALKAACVGACKPDPGSKAVDVVKAETGYQFAWLWDLVPMGDGGEGKAFATFTYDDNTSKFVLPIRTPSTTGYGQGGWEPTGDPVPAGQGPAWAARFKGGPFTEYGGGFGMSLRTISNTVDPLVSTKRDMNPSIQLLEQTPSAEFPDPSAGAYDLSTWEGVAIWVRRGPDGQSTMRLGITERNSAEDLNSSAIVDYGGNKPPGIEEGKYCKRWRYCGCSAGTPCTLVPGSADDYRCYDPAFGPPVTTDPDYQINYPHCGTSRCKDKNASTITPDPDPLFMDKSCSLAVQSDGHSDSFCYDPGKDPTPPAKRQRCNNPFSRPITVSTDWQLIKVPFSELRQADEAKVSDEMDLRSVKQFVVTYGGGWIDFWVANVGFYRAAPKP